MNNRKILQVVVLVILVALAWFLWPRLQQNQNEPQISNVTDFQSCQQAGGQIIDGEPVTCKLSDGRTFAEEDQVKPEVVLDYPKYGDVVKSPLTVVGKAKGNWFFEAQMPVILRDDKGNELFHGPAHAQGDWMTTDYVPFSITFPFDPKGAKYGVLVIEKDNPSALPEFDSSFAIPVKFQ
ncbi:MAG: Gmad2 immunoglobulin-like domain-containing protein [Candidatus Doudnabacteria bacterium]|nr:Gmad2 immunoglobulin-like domain-containing protein [Candidatus Doudnabacteria bacterium]